MLRRGPSGPRENEEWPKKLQRLIKLQCPAGQATPAPPVGPALGQHGINIGQFVKQFNDETRAQQGLVIPVVISVYKDRSASRSSSNRRPPSVLAEEGRKGRFSGANNPGSPKSPAK